MNYKLKESKNLEQKLAESFERLLEIFKEKVFLRMLSHSI